MSAAATAILVVLWIIVAELFALIIVVATIADAILERLEK